MVRTSLVAQVPPFFGAEVLPQEGEAVITGRGACDTKVSMEPIDLSVHLFGHCHNFLRCVGHLHS